MIGLRCKDGIVLAVEKLVLSKLLVPGANKRIATVDRHAGLVRSSLAQPSSSRRASARADAALLLPPSCPSSLASLRLPSQSQATAGLLADGRHLAGRARDECESYRDNYHTRIPTKVRQPFPLASPRAVTRRRACSSSTASLS